MKDLTTLYSSGDAPGILVCRTDALGDVILATPVFRALRRRFPRARITALCREYTAPVLNDNPHIDEVISVPDESRESCNSLVDAFKRQCELPPFDIAIVLYPSEFAVSLVFQLKIPVRIGTAGRWRSWKFTHRVRHSRRENRKSEAAYNLDLLAPLGITSDDTAPEVVVTERGMERAGALIDEHEIGDRFVILHSGSGGSALDWPLERFFELAGALAESGDCDVVFTGSTEEGRHIENRRAGRFARFAGGSKVVSMAGKTDIPTLAALVSQARALVANSTGPLHLAAAVGTPTVGVFPPSKTMSPVRWAPPVDNTVILTPERPRCVCRKSCRRGDCMDSIPVAKVLRAVKSALADTATDNAYERGA